MSVEDYWKHEEELDKKFNEEMDKEFDKLEKNCKTEYFSCNENCINNIGNTCSINNWNCRIKLDKKEMKIH